MPLIYQTVIKRSDLKANPSVLYVFGDNLAEKGLGGQAAEMRGEPNAVGIPTKNAPAMSEASFFSDKDYNDAALVIKQRFSILIQHHLTGGIVVWPHHNIGTGRAELQRRAPRIWELIQNLKAGLEM